MYFEYIYVPILINFNYKCVNKIINVNDACNFIFYLVIIYFQHKTFIWVTVNVYFDRIVRINFYRFNALVIGFMTYVFITVIKIKIRK